MLVLKEEFLDDFFLVSAFCKDRSSHFLFMNDYGNDFCMLSLVFCSDPMRNIPKKESPRGVGEATISTVGQPMQERKVRM